MLKRFFRAIILAVWGGMSLSAPFAHPLAASPLPDIAELVELRVYSGWRAKDTHYMALEFKLADGWKTYWRVPYDTGIPTQLEIESPGVELDEIFWPAPEIFDFSGLKTVGYQKKFIIPFALKIAEGENEIPIKGSVTMGLCFDVCIPARVSFGDILPPNPVRSPKIWQAIENTPKPSREKAICRTKPHEWGIALRAELPVKEFSKDALIVVEILQDNILLVQSDEKYHEGALSVEAVLEEKNGGGLYLGRENLRFTLIEEGRVSIFIGCRG